MSTDTLNSEEVVARPELGFNPETAGDGYRILEFEQRGETYRIQINQNHRFTFGAFAPGGKGNYGTSDFALRIYEGSQKENQVAVFRNVDSVRDISVPVAKMLKTKKGEAKEEVDADGKRIQSRVERGQTWVPVGGGMKTDDIPF